MTVRGTGVNSNPSQSVTATYTFTLVDPCNPPDSVTAGVALENQEYTITDTTKTYTHPENWVITPDYCPLSYTYEIADITNMTGASAITLDGDIFSIYYDSDLIPLEES